MLLVHDDGAEVAQWREDGRARADGDALLAAAEGEPGVVPFAIGEAAVQHRDAVAEDGAEPVHRLRRERDLRDEDDRRLPLLVHHATEELEVDERLAAPGDAVQQRHVPRFRSCEAAERMRLRVAWLVRVRLAQGAREERVACNSLGADLDEATRDQPLEHGRRHAELLGEVLHRRASPERLEQLVGCALLRCAREHPVAIHQRRDLLHDGGDAPCLRRGNRPGGAGQRGGQRRAQRDAERDDVVLGDPLAELEHRRVQHRGVVGRRQDVLELEPLARLGRADDNPHLRLAAERHHHARPDRHGPGDPLGDAVGEGAKEGERKRDVDEGHQPPRATTPNPGPSGSAITPPSIVAPTYGSFATSAAPS